MRRDLAVGLSLATLWFIGVWSDLLPFLYISDRFPIGALPCWNDFAAVVINVVLLGVGFAGAAQLARRGPKAIVVLAQWALLGSLAVPANALRNHFNTPPERLYALLGPTLGLAVFGAVAVLLLGGRSPMAREGRRRRHRGARHHVPAGPHHVRAGWLGHRAGGRPDAVWRRDGPRRGAGRGIAARRVLWIVYDEMDQRTTFDERPGDLRLPAFDRLRAESLAASSALPPADRTERSMPAFLTGLRVGDARLVGRNQLRLQVEGRPTHSCGRAPTRFSPGARALGLNTGLAGFFLPYCAMMGDSVTTCRVAAVRDVREAHRRLRQLAWREHVAPGVGVGCRSTAAAGTGPPSGPCRRPASPWPPIRQSDSRCCTCPVPHEPGIDDRRREATSASAGRRRRLRRTTSRWPIGRWANCESAMESAGLSDKTTVMVFGDHGRRSQRRRVHCRQARAVPGEDGRAVAGRRGHSAPVDLLRVHDLTLEILSGRVVDDRRRQRVARRHR